MSWLSRLANVFRRDRLNRDLEEEAEFHLAARTEDLARGGLSPEEARQEAGRRFGNRLFLRETSREVKLFARLESIVQDAGFGMRLFRKNAVVTGAAVLSLALAIGACTAAFSLIDALILRPLAVKEPHRLVYATFRAPGAPADQSYFNYPLFVRMRDACRAQARLFAVSFQVQREAIFEDSGGQPEKVYAQGISGDAFAILGVTPAAGRLLTAADDHTPGSHPVAVLSHDFWSRRFGRSPAVLGRWMTLREKQYQIVGVAERSFTGVEAGVMTDVWAPNMMWETEGITEPDRTWLRIWGRLEPGATLNHAQAVAQVVFRAFRRERAAARFRPDEPRDGMERYINTPIFVRSAANGPSDIRADFGRPLWILGLVAVLVLLIACSNVASLLIARTAARDREMALRISIGAGRGRLMQQALIESALLSIASCALGALLALKASPLIVGMLSTSRTHVRLDLRPDWRVFLFLAAAGVLTTLIFGLAPALRASAVSPIAALKSGGGRQSARIGLFRPLVAVQTAFSFVVLFIAGLLLVSFARLARSDPGFDANRLVVVDVEARELRQGGPKALAAWSQLVDRLRELPGVESASLSLWSVFTGRGRNHRVRIPGRPVDTSEPFYLPVSPRYLETMRTGLLAGRDFDPRDAAPESPTAVIVNESFVRHYFPRESALGQRFHSVRGGGKAFPQEIVGIARDARYNNLREAPPPTVYTPARPEGSASLQARTNIDPGALAAVLRNQMPSAFRVTGVTLQSALVDNTIVRERLLALLSAFFSVVAMVLVAVGLYGVLSYSVVQRTREIGIRLALGARPSGVLTLVASEAGWAMLAGLGAGLAGGVAASRLVRTLLYEVEPSGLSSLAAPLVCLLLTCAAAALPAILRATRVNPITALRHE